MRIICVLKIKFCDSLDSGTKVQALDSGYSYSLDIRTKEHILGSGYGFVCDKKEKAFDRRPAGLNHYNRYLLRMPMLN